MYHYEVRISYWTGPKGKRTQERACIEVQASNMVIAHRQAVAQLPADAKIIGKSECRNMDRFGGPKISALDPVYRRPA